jgi:hypothetical protein
VPLSDEQRREAIGLLAELLIDAALKREGSFLAAVSPALWGALPVASDRFRTRASGRAGQRDGPVARTPTRRGQVRVQVRRARPALQVDEADSYCGAEGVAGVVRRRWEAHMGAMLFWLGVGLVITLVLLAALAVDRRARRMGHHVRHGSDILSEAWEHGRERRYQRQYVSPGPGPLVDVPVASHQGRDGGWPVGDHPTRRFGPSR